jgi:hypothetical protein
MTRANAIRVKSHALASRIDSMRAELDERRERSLTLRQLSRMRFQKDDDDSDASSRSCSDEEDFTDATTSRERELNVLSTQLARRDEEVRGLEAALRVARDRARDAEESLAAARDEAVRTRMETEKMAVDLKNERTCAVEATEALAASVSREEATSRAFEEASTRGREAVALARELEREHGKAMERLKREIEIKCDVRVEAAETRASELEAALRRERSRARERERESERGRLRDNATVSAADERAEAMREELKNRERVIDEMKIKMERLYDSNAKFKDMYEKAGERARLELRKNSELSERILTLERRISDMRGDHIRAETELKQRVESALLDLQKSRERELAEAKEKFEHFAELENARAALESAESREAHALEAFKSMENAKDSIYKSYIALLAESRS